jgi:thiol:disulfide interchange protein DsbD
LIRSAVLSVLLLTGCAATPSAGPPPEDPYGPSHARVRLISESTALIPGQTATLGVAVDLEPGWHTYWDGLNDTGFPLSLEPVLPEGYTLGTLQWPAPERHVSTGEILDHIYHDQVTLLLPVAIPADAAPNSSVTLSANVSWLTCREACIPGQDSLSITLSVLPEDVAPPPAGGAATRARFERARARIPGPLPGSPTSPVRYAWQQDGTTLVIEAPGAYRMAFFPYRDSAPLASLIRDGEVEGGVLSLGLDGDPGDAPAVTGVLEVQHDQTSAFYTLEIPLGTKENGR